jgi:hypothetical protein
MKGRDSFVVTVNLTVEIFIYTEVWLKKKKKKKRRRIAHILKPDLLSDLAAAGPAAVERLATGE